MGAQAPTGAEELTGPGATVPYVAQGPLLCGGASAAMIERFWGALGVYAEDYAHLVSREAGGIRTGELAQVLAERGHRVDVLRDDPKSALERVRAGVPVMALLESGETRFHYVVVVAVGPDEVRFHDPIHAPERSLSHTEFMRRWAPSDYWALVTHPPEGDAATGIVEPEADPEEGPTTATLPPRLARALEDLRAGRPEEAAEKVRHYLDDRPDDAAHRGTAWEMLASARYLAGDEMGALAAWNVQDQPPVDLVQVRGLRALRYRTVVDPMGIRPRERLTPDGLRLARRRLLQLPSVELGRVGYRPLRDGSVEVEASVLERRRSPLTPLELASVGLGALVNHQAETGFGPLLPVGERWRLEGGWEPARPRAEVSVDVPWAPAAGVVTLRGGWMEERFATAAGTDELWERTWGRATLRRWMDARTRLGFSLGLERWEERGRLARMGASALASLASDRIRVGASVDGWAGGGDEFGRLRLASRAVHRPSEGREWTAVLGGTLASTGAPPTVWDGAGTGRVRAPLLRGHPLVREERMGGAALGRELLHGTLAHSWFAALGPGRASMELFVDAARVWDPFTGDGPRAYLDPGLELGLSAGARSVAVSLARGNGDWVLSARVGSGDLPWLSAP